MNEQITVRLAEQGVLAGIFDTPEDLDLVSEILTPEDFEEPKNATIYACMQQLNLEGKSFDPLSVAHRLSEDGTLGRIGGVAYIQQLVDPETLYTFDTDLLGYSFIVHEASQRRRVAALGKKLEYIVSPGAGYSAQDALNIAETEIRSIADIVVKSDAIPAGDVIDSILDDIEERSNAPEGYTLGVPSGFIDLDKRTTGWKGGQFVILAARPGQGKTTLALDFTRTASIKAGLTTMFFSLEMGRNEIVEKMIAAEARVESQKIKTGKLSTGEWQKVRAATEKIRQARIIIDDSPKISINHIRAAATKQKARPEGLDLIILDYLQLLSSTGRVESRQNEVSEFSRALKLLAKELNVPVISLSQLNRGVESRSDKMPMISDLRESGSLEQDADMIMLLYRPEYYDPNDRPGQALLNLAKHRGGETDVLTLIPLLHYSKFANGAGLVSAPAAPANAHDELGQPVSPVDTVSEAAYSDEYPPVDAPPPSYDEEFASVGPAW